MGEARSGREASMRQIRLGVAFLEGPETRHVTVTPPLLNVLVPIIEEESARVNDCCRRALVVCSQTCIKSDGRRLSHPYRRPAQMQLASVSKIVTTLQDSFD